MAGTNDFHTQTALDYVKCKTAVDDLRYDEPFPSVLDLSVHHNDHMDSSSAIKRHSGEWSRSDGEDHAEDLRLVTRLTRGVTSHTKTPPSKQSCQERNDLADCDLRFEEVKESCNSVPGDRHTEIPDNTYASLSFTFKRKKSSNSDDICAVNLLSPAIMNCNMSLDSACSFEFGKNMRNSNADETKPREMVSYCNETSVLESARSSFGVLPQVDTSQDVRDKKQYDVYAKQFADFLKSTATKRTTEQDSVSTSEESQVSETASSNYAIGEESRAADVNVLSGKETMLLICEEVSQDAEEVALMGVEEEYNDESCQEAKSDVVEKVAEAEGAGEVSSVDNRERKRKRKIKEGDVSETQSCKPKRKKVSLPQSTEDQMPSTSLNAANVFEYQWPQEKNADWFVLQEHISEFLGVLSFKRKYPDIARRPVDIQERNFLREGGVVTEMQCDLGLTALRTEDVCELMSRDYPEKHQEYTKALNKRQKIVEPIKVHETVNTEKNKMENLLKKSVKMAAEYNASLMRELRQERRAYFDLQTFEIHYPRSKMKCVPKEAAKLGSYPVALLPGQFHDYYKRYTQQELNYFPINTAIYSPHKMLKSIYSDPASNVAEDTEDDDSPDNAHDHVSIAKEKRDDKNKNDNTESEKQKPSAVASHDQEGSLGLLDDSAESSRSSFKDGKVVKVTPLTQRMQRLSGKKKGRELAVKCGVCNQVEKNKHGEAEDMVHCSECGSTGHPACLELTKEMIVVIKTYPWQCMECKTCIKCMDPHDEEKMMFCDHCDRGYHTFCVGLKSIPDGRWECPSCRDVTTPPKPKRGRPFKYPRPQTAVNHVTPKATTT